jgi:cell division protein ZapA (FtsZ GTPase activity inhibitor)
MNENKIIDTILSEISSGLNTITCLSIISSVSFIFSIIITLDISKLKKENNKIKILNQEIKQQNEKIKQQNEKMLLKLSLLNDTIFNNNRIISNDIYFQRSNLLEIIDKIDYLVKDKKTYEKTNEKTYEKIYEKIYEKNKICEEKNVIIEDKILENKNDGVDDELLNECYDVMPCNNISKITNSSKPFFKFF